MPTIELNNPDQAVLDGRHIRAAAFEEAQRELLQTLHDRLPTAGPQEARALVLGAGYSRLPRLIADAGYHVTAIDPSAEATAAARSLPTPPGPGVDHRIGSPDRLPQAAGSFDLVWCIDTLEVVDRPYDVLTEISRVIRPTGLAVLDTLNNTFLSRLIYLRVFQQLPGTRIMPPDRYVPGRLLPPERLSDLARDAGLRVAAIHGYEPGSPQALISALLLRRRGSITDAELSARARFRLSRPGHTPPVTYYAVATPASARDDAGRTGLPASPSAVRL